MKLLLTICLTLPPAILAPIAQASIVLPDKFARQNGTLPATPDINLVTGDILMPPVGVDLPGSIKNNGTIIGPQMADEYLTFTGNVSGAGLFQGNVEFAHHHSPGNSPAVVSVEGNLAYGNASMLTIELGGLMEGEFDRLVVQGNVLLSGLINVVLIDGFTPSVGDSFEIIDVGKMLTGQFLGLSEGSFAGSFGGTDLFISYLGGDGNDVTLSSEVSTIVVPELTWTTLIFFTLTALFSFRAEKGLTKSNNQRHSE